MIIRSLDNTATVEILVVGRSPDDSDSSLCVDVVVAGDFAGRNPQIWYDHVALKAFLRDLEILETSREGNAVLDSVSPGECRIRFRCVGLRGRVLVQVCFWKLVYFPDGQGHDTNQLTLNFEMDPGMLQQLVSDIRRLTAECQPI